MQNLAAVVMAAGQGKRMQDPTKPKVLYTLNGEPLLWYVLQLTEKLNCDETIVIIGYGRDQVAAYLNQAFPEARTVIQAEQLGTGHAVIQTESALANYTGDILVLSGDVPLLRLETLQALIETHRTRKALATVLTVNLENPFGYGRIVRSADGASLEKIVEERDADAETKLLHEINSGIYVFDANTLFDSLKTLKPENAQGEYYLTDVFADIITKHGSARVAISTTDSPIEVAGVNTKDQLQALEDVVTGW
jgi:UDP-N-acetylglucosamine diphosphorylase/glucosamine-1-phosphate N-acetyltransferase